MNPGELNLLDTTRILIINNKGWKQGTTWKSDLLNCAK